MLQEQNHLASRTLVGRTISVQGIFKENIRHPLLQDQVVNRWQMDEITLRTNSSVEPNQLETNMERET
jgi:hypothetical protein